MRPGLRYVLARPSTTSKVRRRNISHEPPATARFRGSKKVFLEDEPEELDGAPTPENSSEGSARHIAPPLEIRRSFSGIQPTGVPHLGNYLGALRQWKQLHDQSLDPKFSQSYRHEQYFSVVDLHALTSDVPGVDRVRLRRESFAALLAIGLKNNDHTTLFFQSDVPTHASLMWILSTIASTGYLSRMTQWKSKLNLPDDANLDSDEATAKLKLGLFSYPVLQAADILLYQPSIVPVGEDQLQHIEFTRTLARGFNAHVNRKVFQIPWPVISPAKRIMSLKRPEHKMSKSDADPKSRILITDSADDIRAKFKGAVTDSEAGISFDPERRPGVSNLVEILKHVTESRESSEFIAKDNANISMRAFKEMIAAEVIKALTGIRENFLQLTLAGKEDILREEIEAGGQKARRKARITLADVNQALGLTDAPLTNEEASRLRTRRSQRAGELGLAIEGNPFEEDEGGEGQMKP